ncbi:hypothetical protein PRZ48_000587 [Zasmidium cellare]|uniref:F-box domain-containing protein n=1 Tax=Zasmidium cellare TaxID=395010 RepID=A0ABR0EYX6_ZASCE|nr:hypothetical protein PRZ48_000587 [Zasmidium cellare]
MCGGPFRNGGLVPPEGHQYSEDLEFAEADRRFGGLFSGLEPDYCDDAVLSEQSVAWLRDVRAIGKTKHKAFITGPGIESPSGDVLVELGDDPNVPGPHQAKWQSQPGRLHLDVYSNDSRAFWHPSYPIHVKCFDILLEVNKYRANDKEGAPVKIDLEYLHKGMQKQELWYNFHLGLESYAEFGQHHGQWWEGPAESLEPWYHDPIDVPVLNSLNRTTQQHRRIRVWARGSTSAANCLSDLPAELLLLVANQLDIRSVIHLTLTCREVNAVLSKNFWRRRLLEDMPYLFEIRQAISKDSSLNDAIDWQDLYGRMLLQSNPGPWDRIWWKFTDTTRKLPKDADLKLEYFGGYGRKGLLKRGNMVSKFDPTLIGIASRRRVWRCAEELLDLCDKHALDGNDTYYETESEDEEPEHEEARTEEAQHDEEAPDGEAQDEEDEE